MVEAIVGAVVIGAILGWALGRWGVRLGVVFLVIGLGPFVGLYVYETFFYTSGDTSGIGMFSTLCLILFAPFGVILVVFGLLRGD
ncbi:MAG TPA: hypothetical protein VMZ06_01740 [Candidatus Bathyarchaeia archaeon]|nr:hypothetical protein [Candidatus Bathyarchaeia archaeon]